MGLTDLIFGGKSNARVGVIEFDASISEIHSDEVEITDHPVEVGSDVSDHIRKLPVTLELNGVVTNNPLVFLASFFAKSPKKNDLLPTQDRVGAAYDELRRIQDNGEQVDVATSLRDYTNMVIQSLSISRDANTGNILDATITLREIIQAKSLSIELPIPTEVVNNTTSNEGNKDKKSATPEQTDKAVDTNSSMFKDLIKGAIR